MKKFLLVAMFCLAMSGVSGLASAAPVGNPASPKQLSSKWLLLEDYGVKLSGEVDAVSDFKVEDTQKTKMTFSSGKITLSIKEKVDIYGILGAADFQINDVDTDGDEWEISTERDFAWGVGTTVLLCEPLEAMSVGIDAKFRYLEPDINRITLNGTSYDLPSGDVTRSNFECKEWQVALGASYEVVPAFIPYAGIKYSDIDFVTKATVAGTELKSDSSHRDDKIGLFVGCNILPLDNMSFNLEGRFIDEEAFNFTTAVKF